METSWGTFKAPGQYSGRYILTWPFKDTQQNFWPQKYGLPATHPWRRGVAFYFSASDLTLATLGTSVRNISISSNIEGGNRSKTANVSFVF